MSLVRLVVWLLAFFPWVDFAVRRAAEEGYVPLAPARAWDDAFLIGSLAVACWARDRRRPPLIPLAVRVGTLVFVAAGAVSILINRVPLAIAVDAFRVIYQPLLFTVLTMLLLRDQRLRDEWLTCTLAGAVGIAVVALGQYALGSEGLRWSNKPSAAQFRVAAIFANPNALAGYLNMALAFALACAVLGPDARRRRIYWLHTALFAAGVVVTFSRSAWIALVAMGLSFAWMAGRRLFVLPAIVIACLLFLSGSVGGRAAELLQPGYYEQSARLGRVAFWETALITTGRNPFFGVGLGMFGDSVAIRHGVPGATWVDNHYLKLAAEVGVLGAAAVLGLLFALFLRAAAVYRRASDARDQTAALGLGGVLLVMAIQNGTASLWEALYVGTLFYASIGVLLGRSWQPRAAAPAPKIVHLIGGGEGGGSRVHVVTLCRALSDRVGVELICLMEGPVAESARRAGVPVTVLPMRHTLDWSAVPRLRRHLERTAPGVVHTHGVRANFIGRCAAHDLGIPIVTTVHSSIHSDYRGSPKRWFYPRIERATRRYSDRFIAVAAALGDELRRDGVAAERIAVVHNCLPPAGEMVTPSVSLREQLALPAETPIVISVGRLEPVKDPDRLLEVLAALRRRRRFHAVIVGDGSLRKRLHDTVRDLGLADDVSFLGLRDDVSSLLAQGDVMLSTSTMEGLSLVLLEAMRAGVPVVVSAVGGMAEVVGAAGNGFSVPQADVAGYVEHLDRLLGDASLRADCAKKGLRAIDREFSLAAFLAGTEAVYDAARREGMRRHRATRITIAGYYGAGNGGDEAILAGLLASLDRRDGVEVTVLSFGPQATERMHHVESLFIGRRGHGIASLLRHLRRADLFVLGGGGLLQDSGARVVPFWLSRALLAMLVHTPVMFCALGVGPLASRTARRLVGWVARRAELITVRDRSSQTLLRDCGAERVVIDVSADAALCLPVDVSGGARSTARRAAPARAPLTLAVCLRDWRGDRRWPAAMARCLGDLRRGRAIRYLFVPLHDREDDRIAAEVWRRLSGDVGAPPDSLLRLEPSPRQMVAALGGADGVISMRLHGLILGALAGAPVFGLAADAKLEHFLEAAAIGSDSVSPVDVVEDPARAVAKMGAWIELRAQRHQLMQPALQAMILAARHNARRIDELARRRAAVD